MIALNEVRADLKLAAAWCDVVGASARGTDFYGQVFLLNSGRVTVAPMVALAGRHKYSTTANKIARECLELVGYPPVTYATYPPRTKSTWVSVGPRSHHDHALAIRYFKAFGMTP